jgi:hypothetical protein
MPRYIVIRPYAEVLDVPVSEEGARKCSRVVENNSMDEVTWIHSYISHHKQQTFCVYDAPSPEAVRRAARRNKLPVDQIVEVHLLDPYFYR